MKSKILLKRKLLIVILSILFLSLITLLYFNLRNSTHGSSMSISEQGKINILADQSSFGLPVRLKIPKISVNATVEYVGLTPDKAMDVPQGPDNVAWFYLGPRPGENGTAVIDGHFGWKNKIPAVFDDLYKLQKGDKIFVEDEKGITTTFIVRESRKYDSNADASNVFISNDGLSHLNLISCTGVWNPIEKSRANRLVVFADKE